MSFTCLAMIAALFQQDPSIIMKSDEQGSLFAVSPLGEDVTRWMQARTPSQADFRKLLRVFVNRKGRATEPSPLIGAFRLHDRELQFRPRYGLLPGVSYRVEYRPKQLGMSSESLAAEFLIPKKKSIPANVVAIYPSAGIVPENLLKFYIHFSARMSHGFSYRNIHLYRKDGTEVDYPFLELGEELWDPSSRRFTLLIDPGRIKREVKPLEEIGPSLESGKEYQLVITRGWLDVNGNKLREEYRKKFKVQKPVRRRIDTALWKFRAPPAKTRQPLLIDFPYPLDHALAARVITVHKVEGGRIDGQVALRRMETQWIFSPKDDWVTGKYFVLVETVLEDLSGNSVEKAFELDVFNKVESITDQKTLKIQFRIAES